jgi:2-iminobutanoate/2-iminopropanoate deaminase
LSEKQVVRTEAAPAPFQGAPYNQAISAGGLVFVSGQLGLVPGETMLEGKGIEAQTRQVLENIKAILEEAGSGLSSLLKTTVFLADLADFAAMNAVYSGFVGEMPPARATVQVAALPSGALVEIDAVALVG